MIKVYRSTTDFSSKTKSYKTLAGARKFAQKCVGETPDISHQFHYAVGTFGDVKVEVSGEDETGKPVSIFDLFPKCENPEEVTSG